MKLSVLDLNGAPTGEVALDDEHLIQDGRGTQALQEYVVTFQRNQRQGTRSAKTRAEVAGSGKKPWRQKGTGRARVGSVRSPIWRKGGVVFGPRPRDFSRRLPRQISSLAFRKAFSERIADNNVVVVDGLESLSHKTKDFLAVLGKWKIDGGRTLIVQDEVNRNLMLASRNVPTVEVITVDALNAYELLAFQRIVFTRKAFAAAVERLRKQP